MTVIQLKPNAVIYFPTVNRRPLDKPLLCLDAGEYFREVFPVPCAERSHVIVGGVRIGGATGQARS